MAEIHLPLGLLLLLWAIETRRKAGEGGRRNGTMNIAMRKISTYRDCD